jgi:acetyl esterase
MSLAPEIRAYLEAGAAAGLPQVWEAPIEVIRRNRQSQAVFSGPAETVTEVVNRFFPGPTSDLPIRIYRPTTDAKAPAIIYLHGGGWALNFLDIYDASLSRLANQSGATIISVHYQKAPEHPFPIPFDDCYATLLWVIENSDALQIDKNKIGVAGDSAGGNLASAVAIKARDNGIKLAFQLLVYPCNDRDFDTDSYKEFATGYGLTTQAMEWFWDKYLQGHAHDKNPYAIPQSATDFSALAPAIFITAEYDPLSSDSEKYAEALRKAGVGVAYREYAGMIHGFYSIMGITPTAAQAIDFAAAEIRKLIK